VPLRRLGNQAILRRYARTDRLSLGLTPVARRFDNRGPGPFRDGRLGRGAQAVQRRVRRDVCLPEMVGPGAGATRTSGAKTSSGAGGHSDRCQGSRSLLFTAGSGDPGWGMSVAITGASAGCLDVKQRRCAIRQIARSGTSFSGFRSGDFRTQCSHFRNQRAGGQKRMDNLSRRAVGTPLAADANVLIARHLPCNDAWRRMPQVPPCCDRVPADLPPERVRAGARSL
jgi:hypothetical protein